MTDPKPFRIHVPDAVLDDLRERLGRVRWPDEIPGGGWTYGTDLATMTDLIAYWRDGFDWRAQEAALNAWPQFTTPLGDIDVHFVHARGVGPAPMPLLLSHGWPGSIVEFQQLLPRLTDPARFGGDPRDAFTVVAPSLPGYTFSFRPGQPRLGLDAVADVFAALMGDVLGYSRFGAQGGDWGAVITALLAARHPARLAGIHVNLLVMGPDAAFGAPTTDDERAYLDERRRWDREETGYQWIQGTKPQTLAYGLTDSPVGLLAWILEKFRTWTDCGGDVLSRVARDPLLTNVTLYWATGAINASFWPYYWVRHTPWPLKGARIAVPTGYAAFPHEIQHPPRTWAERIYDIRRWTVMKSGGHFAALEEPEALATDIAEFFRPLR